MGSRVAVSGITGFIGAHIASDLLSKGYIVHGTVRRNTPERLAHITSHPNAAESLKVFEADLARPGSFDECTNGCKWAIHVASPYAMDAKDPQKELVDPAVNGTLSFLRSCKAAGVEKVVLTSSIASVSDEARADHVFTEADFNTKSSLTRLPYYFSKAEAERAAWKFVEEEAADMKLVVINPSIVIGPNLTKSMNESAVLIKHVVNGTFRGIVDLTWTFVDVRDVSKAHIMAMESENASGRYICAASEKPISMKEMTALLQKRGYKPPTLNLTSSMTTGIIRKISYITPGGQEGVYTRNFVGTPFVMTNEKIKKELGMSFRDVEQTLNETIDDLVAKGHMKSPT